MRLIIWGALWSEKYSSLKQNFYFHCGDSNASMPNNHTTPSDFRVHWQTLDHTSESET